MKKFKEVDADRRKFRDAVTNTVHRASLMVPEIEGTKAEISFLNHFLLKRGYKDASCKITAIDLDGKKIESRLHQITEPRVYTIRLSGMVERPVSQYMVEFYCAQNLFMPAPAVMVNHVGKGFVNQVHAFNRILNDVFEDDAINAVHVNEASIDLKYNDQIDTFLLFSVGAQPCKGQLTAEILTATKRFEASLEVDLPRFATRRLSLRELFKDLPRDVQGTLKIRQPKQSMFYGRMLAGQLLPDGAFSANHSYYDSSTVEEYWENSSHAQRSYPFIPELENVMRIYPIMSPGSYALSIALHSPQGKTLKTFEVGEIVSPGSQHLDIDINALAKKAGLAASDVSSYTIETKCSENQMPTRITHQLVYGAGKGLQSSINESIMNEREIFVPEGKKGFAWGQVALSHDYDGYLGVIAEPLYNKYAGASQTFELKLFSSNGLIATRQGTLNSGAATSFNFRKDFSSELKTELTSKDPAYIWYTLESDCPGVFGFSVSRNIQTAHCSGEHSF